MKFGDGGDGENTRLARRSRFTSWVIERNQGELCFSGYAISVIAEHSKFRAAASIVTGNQIELFGYPQRPMLKGPSPVSP